MEVTVGGYALEDIERAVQGMTGLEQIIVPLLLEINHEGMGQEDVEEFKLHLQIARDALKFFAKLGGLFVGQNDIH